MPSGTRVSLSASGGLNDWRKGTASGGSLKKSPPEASSSPIVSPARTGRFVVNVLTPCATFTLALVATAVYSGGEERRTRSATGPAAAPALRRQRTIRPSIGETAIGATASEVWT